MKKFDIAIMGGDKRAACMGPVFLEKGCRVITYGTVKLPITANIYRTESFREAVENSRILVCGIPFQHNGCLFFQESMPDIPLTELQRCLRKHQEVFGGVIPENFRRHCEEREIGCYDFMRDEALTVFNAIATAEGAILEALLHKDTNLHHSKTLVLGYGRCGKVLADKLLGLNARVTVCSAAPQELALADSMGMDTLLLPRLTREICNFEYIFNTIPSLILTDECLQAANTNSLIIDIASNQGGVDYKAAKQRGISACHCLGLPGKYAGYSSAQRLAEYVISKIP